MDWKAELTSSVEAAVQAAFERSLQPAIEDIMRVYTDGSKQRLHRHITEIRDALSAGIHKRGCFDTEPAVATSVKPQAAVVFGNGHDMAESHAFEEPVEEMARHRKRRIKLVEDMMRRDPVWAEKVARRRAAFTATSNSTAPASTLTACAVRDGDLDLASHTTYSMQCPSRTVTLSVPALAPVATSTPSSITIDVVPERCRSDPVPVAAASSPISTLDVSGAISITSSVASYVREETSTHVPTVVPLDSTPTSVPVVTATHETDICSETSTTYSTEGSGNHIGDGEPSAASLAAITTVERLISTIDQCEGIKLAVELHVKSSTSGPVSDNGVNQITEAPTSMEDTLQFTPALAVVSVGNMELTWVSPASYSMWCSNDAEASKESNNSDTDQSIIFNAESVDLAIFAVPRNKKLMVVSAVAGQLDSDLVTDVTSLNDSCNSLEPVWRIFSKLIAWSPQFQRPPMSLFGHFAVSSFGYFTQAGIALVCLPVLHCAERKPWPPPHEISGADYCFACFAWEIAWVIVGMSRAFSDFGGNGHFASQRMLLSHGKKLICALLFQTTFCCTALQSTRDTLQSQLAGILCPMHSRLGLMLLGVLVVWAHLILVQITQLLFGELIFVVRCEAVFWPILQSPTALYAFIDICLKQLQFQSANCSWSIYLQFEQLQDIMGTLAEMTPWPFWLFDLKYVDGRNIFSQSLSAHLQWQIAWSSKFMKLAGASSLQAIGLYWSTNYTLQYGFELLQWLIAWPLAIGDGYATVIVNNLVSKVWLVPTCICTCLRTDGGQCKIGWRAQCLLVENLAGAMSNQNYLVDKLMVIHKLIARTFDVVDLLSRVEAVHLLLIHVTSSKQSYTFSEFFTSLVSLALLSEELRISWDPGGRKFFGLFTQAETKRRNAAAPAYDRGNYQDHAYLFNKVCAEQDYYLNIAKICLNYNTDGDLNEDMKHQVPWDPSGSTWHRLEVKPKFKEGGMLSTSPFLGRTMGCLYWAWACREPREPAATYTRGSATNNSAWNGTASASSASVSFSFL